MNFVRQTNYQNLKALLNVYTPAKRGFITGEETEKIENMLQLDSMSIIELRNLRDFVVLCLSQDKEDTKETRLNMDRMSAITYVIDSYIVGLKQDLDFYYKVGVDRIHEDGSLDATIAELTIIVHEYEDKNLDHLQRDCYKRALKYLTDYEKHLEDDRFNGKK